MRIIYIILAVIFLPSCEVLKSKRRETTDTVYVSKVDSGFVKKTDVVKTDTFQWWRVLMDYRDNGDTSITNVYNTYPQPKVVVVEGGNGSSQTIIQQVDSGYKHRYDSLRFTKDITEKSKETKVMTQWWIWLILGVLGFLVIMLTVGRYFTITKK